jgi:hypothetical protein
MNRASSLVPLAATLATLTGIALLLGGLLLQQTRGMAPEHGPRPFLLDDAPRPAVRR